MRHRRRRHESREVRKCKEPECEAPVKAMGCCIDHLPDKIKCGECGAFYPWRPGDPGVCPACYYPFMLKMREENPGYIGWQYTNWEALHRKAEEFKQSLVA